MQFIAPCVRPHVLTRACVCAPARSSQALPAHYVLGPLACYLLPGRQADRQGVVVPRSGLAALEGRGQEGERAALDCVRWAGWGGEVLASGGRGEV